MSDPLPTIAYDDFAKLDLRVATITAAEHHPGADRLLTLQLDDGTEGGRQVCAGIRSWYDPQDLVGSQVVIVANLEARKIRGEISDGMVLAGTIEGEDGPTDVAVLRIDRAVPAGSRVS